MSKKNEGMESKLLEVFGIDIQAVWVVGDRAFCVCAEVAGVILAGNFGNVGRGNLEGFNFFPIDISVPGVIFYVVHAAFQVSVSFCEV